MTEILYVYQDVRRVGQISDDFVFQYVESWLGDRSAFPISASLPFKPAPFSEREAHPFFGNLLPEGPVRSLIARRLGVSEENDFALLKALGGDCAGALSLWPDPQPDPRPALYQDLTDLQLDEKIDAMDGRPLLAFRGRTSTFTCRGAAENSSSGR